MNATVNPNGDLTTVTFEINGNGGYCQQTIGNGTTDVPVTCDTTTTTLNPLTASTSYTVRAVAINTINITDGNVVNFTTLAPAVFATTTNTESGVGTTSATLNGSWIDNDSNDPITTWFLYDTDLVLDLSTSTVAQGTASSGSFADSISGLTENTLYYFQAYAQDSSGTVSGSVLSFTTGSTPPPPPPPSGGGSPTIFPPEIITTSADAIGLTSATLNATWDSKGYSTTTWFEYGLTQTLLSSTTSIIQGTGSGTLAETLTGLDENTVYYFRAVGQNSFGTEYGAILSFTTTTTVTTPDPDPTPTVVVANPAPTVTTPTTTPTTPTVTISTVTELDTDLITLSVTTEFDTVAVGDDVIYTVQYSNDSDSDLEDVVIQIILPQDIEFISSTNGEYLESAHTLTVNLGTLNSDANETLTIDARVDTSASVDDILLTTVKLLYSDPITFDVKDEIAYSIITVTEGQNLLGAAAVLSGILPDTVAGWVVSLLVIIGLGLLGRELYVNTSLFNRRA